MGRQSEVFYQLRYQKHRAEFPLLLLFPGSPSPGFLEDPLPSCAPPVEPGLPLAVLNPVTSSLSTLLIMRFSLLHRPPSLAQGCRQTSVLFRHHPSEGSDGLCGTCLVSELCRAPPQGQSRTKDEAALPLYSAKPACPARGGGRVGLPSSPTCREPLSKLPHGLSSLIRFPHSSPLSGAPLTWPGDRARESLNGSGLPQFKGGSELCPPA